MGPFVLAGGLCCLPALILQCWRLLAWRPSAPLCWWLPARKHANLLVPSEISISKPAFLEGLQIPLQNVGPAIFLYFLFFIPFPASSTIAVETPGFLVVVDATLRCCRRRADDQGGWPAESRGDGRLVPRPRHRYNASWTSRWCR
jgi:hypothetical protein